MYYRIRSRWQISFACDEQLLSPNADRYDPLHHLYTFWQTDSMFWIPNCSVTPSTTNWRTFNPFYLFEQQNMFGDLITMFHIKLQPTTTPHTTPDSRSAADKWRCLTHESQLLLRFHKQNHSSQIPHHFRSAIQPCPRPLWNPALLLKIRFIPDEMYSYRWCMHYVRYNTPCRKHILIRKYCMSYGILNMILDECETKLNCTAGVLLRKSGRWNNYRIILTGRCTNTYRKTNSIVIPSMTHAACWLNCIEVV